MEGRPLGRPTGLVYSMLLWCAAGRGPPPGTRAARNKNSGVVLKTLLQLTNGGDPNFWGIVCVRVNCSVVIELFDMLLHIDHIKES